MIIRALIYKGFPTIVKCIAVISVYFVEFAQIYREISRRNEFLS